jgi:hypothetical protein
VNGPTALATYAFGLLVLLLIGLVARAMVAGWRRRAARQAAIIGDLPAAPARLGRPVIASMRGLYIGTASAADWLERIVAGGLGPRSSAALTRYPEGILLERAGADPIWMPQESVTAVGTAQALAGKVIPGGEFLVIRWRLPSGVEIDTGFRGSDRHDYPRWTEWTGEAA